MIKKQKNKEKSVLSITARVVTITIIGIIICLLILTYIKPIISGKPLLSPNTLPTPTNLTASAISVSSIVLSWDSVIGAESYIIESSRSPYVGFVQIYNSSALSYQDTGLLSDTYYYYKIKAINNGGESNYTTDSWTKTQTNDIPVVSIGGVNTECFDGIDNDGDGLIDMADFGCFGPNGQETNTDYGFTQFIPSSDTKIYYVSSTGDDNNDGLSPEHPIKTPIYATAKLRSGYPDWLLFKRGDTWLIPNTTMIPPIPNSGGNPLPAGWSNFVMPTFGRSISERMLIGSYGNSFARPKFINGMIRSGSYTAFAGLDLERPAERGEATTGISFGGSGDGILIEDNYVSGYIINMDITGTGVGYSNTSVRRNIIVDAYTSDGGHSQGFSSFGGTDKMLVEGNFFDHNGYKDGVPGAYDTQFNHNTYFGGSTTNALIKDDISARSSNVGLSARGGGFIENNLLLQNPIGISAGYFPYNDRAVGTILNNVILDGRDIIGDSGSPQGQGWAISIGAIGSNTSGLEVAGNVVAHQKTGTGPSAILTSGGYSTGLNMHDNLIYDWPNGLEFQYNAYVSPNIIANNNIQQPNGATVVVHNNGALPGTSAFTYSGNNYYSSDNSNNWFDVGSSPMNFSNWIAKSGETGATKTQSSFVDSSRDIASYMAYLGYPTQQQNLESFLAEARLQSKVNWREEFTAHAVNEYIREGFKVTNITVVKPECSDGIDNDGDGLVDWQYDLSCINATDNTEKGISGQLENGWTNFEPSNDTRIIYVSDSTGNDAWDGLAPEWNGTSGPKKIPYRAAVLIRNGYPDWLLLKRGDTFYPNAEPLIMNGWTLPANYSNMLGDFSGRFLTEPMVLGSYGNGTERPIIMGGRVRLLGTHYFVMVGLDLQPGDYRGVTGAGLAGAASDDSNILIEDNRFSGYNSNINIQGAGNGIFNLTFRRNVIDYAWEDNGGHSQGILLTGAHNVTFEENIFDHNGWQENHTGAEATIFNHNVYIQTGGTGITLKDNIISRASSHGFQMRPGGVVTNNLLIENAIAGFTAGGDQTLNLNKSIMDKNVVIGGRDINGAERGWGLSAQGGSADITNNLFTHKQCSQGAKVALEVATIPAGTVINIANNVVYNWCGNGYGDESNIATPIEGTLVNLTNNVFISPGGGSLMYTFKVFSAIHQFSKNKYYRTGSLDDGTYINNWFQQYGGAALSANTWPNTSGETDATFTPVNFPDPNRSIETYMTRLGGTPTIDAFLSEARQQSKYNWRQEYTAGVVNEYIREGFGMNTTKVILPTCGNGIKESGEQCDDGNKNNNDACSNQCTINTVKQKGNKILDFDGKRTTNITNESNLSKVGNFKLEREGKGEIAFIKEIDFRKYNFSNQVEDIIQKINDYVNIYDKSIIIDSQNLPELNQSATLTMYNLTETKPKILMNGQTCPSDICQITSYANRTLIFTVTHFTNYTIIEDTTSTTTPSNPSGGGGGGGGGSTSNTKNKTNMTTNTGIGTTNNENPTVRGQEEVVDNEGTQNEEETPKIDSSSKTIMIILTIIAIALLTTIIIIIRKRRTEKKRIKEVLKEKEL